MWLSGPVPAKLRLDDLPGGASFDRPSLPALLPRERAVVAVETTRVSLSVLSELGWGINPIMQIVQQRALDRLRGSALSYSVEFTPVRIGGGHALKYVEADGAEAGLGRVAADLVDVVHELATSGPRDDEVAVLREYQQQFRDHPQKILADLEGLARLRLLDGETLGTEETEAVIDALDAAGDAR